MLLDHGLQRIATETKRHTEDSRIKPVIYVSGPFRGTTSWTIEQNIRVAESMALRLWKLGAAVICPHALTRYYQGELVDDAWLAGDLAMLRGVDAIFMLPGWEKSEGSLIEKCFAENSNIHVLFSVKLTKEYILNYVSQHIG